MRSAVAASPTVLKSEYSPPSYPKAKYTYVEPSPPTTTPFPICCSKNTSEIQRICGLPVMVLQIFLKLTGGTSFVL